MAGRTRGYKQDWDPMQEEFDDSSNPQNGDDRSSMDLMDHCRLHITNIPRALNQDGLYTAFSKFGNLVECFVSADPEKRYALVAFETPGEAKLAMMKLNRTEPLNLYINVAYKRTQKKQVDDRQRSYNNGGARTREDRGYRDNVSASSSVHQPQPREVSASSSGHRPQPRLAESRQDMANGDSFDNLVEDAGLLNKSLEPDMELELLRLEQLKVHEQQLACKHRILLIKQKKSTSNTRYVMPDGKIVVRTVDSEDQDDNFGSGGGDANRESEQCSSEDKIKVSSKESDASSSASTCVLCSEDRSQYDQQTSADKSDSNNKTDSDKTAGNNTVTDTKTTYTSKMDVSSKNNGKSVKKYDSIMTYGDFHDDSENEADETNRLIHLRNTDYQDIIEDNMKIVIALAGYPKAKIRLQQLELFQQCLRDVLDMQEKAGLLKKPPVFLDYYLNRGAIVCICRDIETRNWMVRITPGLQERMSTNLILLKSKLKRLCLAYLKIPVTCWPATAQDVFKLLQYFNPTLRVDMWRVYSQSKVDDVEYTSFLIDRVSGEIIRGPSFKNVIDYKQMEFELSRYTEIYYECLMSDIKEDLHSVSSRVKLLNELKSAEGTPRNNSDCSLLQASSVDKETARERPNEEPEEFPDKVEGEVNDVGKVNKEPETDPLETDRDVLDNHKEDNEDNCIHNDEEIAIDSEDNVKNKTDNVEDADDIRMAASESVAAYSEITESIVESNDNLIARNSNINIDSNRGIAYHRRTNYLHVENELKTAITLEGYPQDKLEGTHIRRLKLLFKEYLHKDMKQQRFANLIIPKFQDVYLSNGAVIYICDSLETKDYLTEILPKLVNSTGWKLTFKDVKHLVRYTRIVMKLPKEHANVESKEILQKLQEKYFGLKPECWKYYSDVAGKQKRQFGVDPESLDVIKGPDFDPIYAGQKLTFRIIDRQRRDPGLEETNQNCDEEIQDYEEIIENTELKEKVLRLLYVPIKPYTANSLNRVRTSHYSDEVADDLKLYVGPTNYPETRIDETLFHTIKRTFEIIVYKSFEKYELNELSMPRFHDIYLFDGVIFVICQNMSTRCWVDEVLAIVNTKLQITLQSTEYRGAVGFVSMSLKTCLSADEVTSILQSNNPRLRTKFWRTITTIKSKTKLDVVMQIDKLSAEVIKSPNFNKYVGDNIVEFQLGHLQTLLQPLLDTEAPTKRQQRKLRKTNAKKQRELKTKGSSTINDELTFAILKKELKDEYPDFNLDDCTVSVNASCDINPEVIEPVTKIEAQQPVKDLVPIIIESDNKISSIENEEKIKMVVNIPSNILPKEEEDLSLIFDLLEDNNPGLNPELWAVTNNFGNYEKGKFILTIDKQSASVIRSNKFCPIVLGHKLKVLL